LAVACNLREYQQLDRNAGFIEVPLTSLRPTLQQALAAQKCDGPSNSGSVAGAL
jgi:hypothetical protein